MKGMKGKTFIATEAGHWYQQDGTPLHEIEAKNGKGLRPVTLRDARTLNLVPSVTGILNMLPKPQLIVWQKKQVLLAALTLTRQPEENDEVYIRRIMADADAQAHKARERGTAVHTEIEKHLLGEIESVKARAVLNALASYLMLADFGDILGLSEPEKSFAHPLGYGGKVDLHSKQLNFVCDFKTKEFTEEIEKLAYDEQILQLVGYADGLNMPDARLINVYISTKIEGLIRVVEHENIDRTYYRQLFGDCLRLWKTLKKYDGSEKAKET